MTGLKDNRSLFLETGKGSEQLRNRWISLIVLWVALWESVSKTEGTRLWALETQPGPRWAQEFLQGDVWQVQGAHPHFSARPDLGGESTVSK